MTDNIIRLNSYTRKLLSFLLKLLSQSWWILIFKLKKNHNKQQYFTDNHYQYNTSLNFIEFPWCLIKQIMQIKYYAKKRQMNV